MNVFWQIKIAMNTPNIDIYFSLPGFLKINVAGNPPTKTKKIKIVTKNEIPEKINISSTTTTLFYFKSLNFIPFTSPVKVMSMILMHFICFFKC